MAKKKMKMHRSFGEDFNNRFGTVEFLDKGEALRIVNEIIMEDKSDKMRAAQKKLRELREANRIANQETQGNEDVKMRSDWPEIFQEPIVPEDVAEVPSEVVQHAESEKNLRVDLAKGKEMEEAQQRLEEDRKQMFARGKPILVDHSRVLRGERYLSDLKVGDRVHFWREFGHSWDPNAIAVLREDGLKIGYLDYHLSADMARDINKKIVYAAEFVAPASERGYSLFRML